MTTQDDNDLFQIDLNNVYYDTLKELIIDLHNQKIKQHDFLMEDFIKRCRHLKYEIQELMANINKKPSDDFTKRFLKMYDRIDHLKERLNEIDPTMIPFFRLFHAYLHLLESDKEYWGY